MKTFQCRKGFMRPRSQERGAFELFQIHFEEYQCSNLESRYE